MTLVDSFTVMKLPLLRRRPEVNTLGRWLMQMTVAVGVLDGSSQQLLGRMCHVAWLVVGEWRVVDIVQPVYEQTELSRLAAVLRQMSITLGRYFPSANGPQTLALTPDAAVALANLESWDPTANPTFDVTVALLRLANGTRFQ